MASKNELIKVTDHSIEVPVEVLNMIEDFTRQQREYKAMEKKLKDELTKAMRENGIKKVESADGSIVITYVAPTVRKDINKTKMRDDGIYDDYLIAIPVDDHVRIVVGKGKDE